MTIQYDVFSLASVNGAEYEVLRERVYERLESFECKRSTHLEQFAREKVRRFERHGNSRTYVLIVADGATDIDVAGFFTIGMSSLDLSNTNKALRRKLSGDISIDSTGAFAIAELARSDKYTHSQLPGSVILDEAKNVIRKAREHVGGRFAVVDAQPEIFEKLYKPAGFRKLHIANPPRGMQDKDFITACCVIRDW